jgi:uncharacterized membrane protein
MSTVANVRPATYPMDTAPGGGAEPHSGATRLNSIDIIRGAVMVLMAVDHVRVFSGVPAGGPSVDVFLTRWITHFCAPAFVFLAGTGAFLHGQKLQSRAALSRYLLTRGALLLMLELTVIRFSWTFNFDLANYNLAGVIWVIGWGMILLAGLVHLPVASVAASGLAIVAGHNILDAYSPQLGASLQESPFAWLWQVLYFGFGGEFRVGAGGPTLVVLYTIVPWIGVMAAGYAFGAVMRLPAAQRRRICVAIGAAAIAMFVILRGFNVYGDPRAWSPTGPMPPALSFLNTTKYPASFLFLLMTLGPVILLIPVLEHARGRVARWLATFGRVPLLFYLLHIPLIHVMAVLISLVRTPGDTAWLFANHPMRMPPAPDGYMWSLPLLYAVTLFVVVILYFPCRRFAGVKARRKDGWLSYL